MTGYWVKSYNDTLWHQIVGYASGGAAPVWVKAHCGLEGNLADDGQVGLPSPLGPVCVRCAVAAARKDILV